MEIWKDIKGYEGCYQISNLGRIKSVQRKVRYLQTNYRNEYFRLIKEKILSNGNCKGYNFVSLNKERKIKYYRVCRLVAITFIPNHENKPQVNHIDGNKLNDCLYNLEWVSPKENMIHAKENGLIRHLRGKENPRSKRVFCIKSNKIFDTILEASIYIGLSQSQLSRVLRNKYKNTTSLILLDA
jgi:hypothetical protein